MGVQPLTGLVPIKFRVEVLLGVKGYLDLVSHQQPLVRDRLTQVPRQVSSKAQAVGGTQATAPHCWLGQAC